jgi:UDP-N-acetylglucosamine--N-acetylmuramyl-(pentapeptide) pyrophosphoryl-undecaprenol N-acetylglucosamine transferase
MNQKILIMAAGTGGHILPALSVAKALQAYDIEIHWLGTEFGLEQKLIPPTKIPIHTIKMRGIRGKGIVGLLIAPFRLLYAACQAIHLIRKLKPTTVIGFGGFVTAPGGLASWLLRKPLILHEQNAVAGLSNRCLSYLATIVFQAFPDTFPLSRHAITCGNPVRAEIIALPSPELRFKNPGQPLRVLIIGGSLGAAVFNQIIPETLGAFALSERPEVWHSTGKGAAEKVQNTYNQSGITAHVVEFIADMSRAYAWADLVICRAGASTIAELAAVGVASILIPYPHAVDDHQTKNGAWLVNAGAAILIPQNQLNPQKLAALLVKFSSDRQALLDMAMAARTLAITDATQRIVEAVIHTQKSAPPSSHQKRS